MLNDWDLEDDYGLSDIKSRPLYDSLSDFHLRNPLKELSIDEYERLNVSIRNKNSRAAINKYVFAKQIEIGSHIDLINDKIILWEKIDDNYAKTAVQNVLFSLKMDQCFQTHIDISAWSEAFKKIKENFPISLWYKMRSYVDIVTVINAISSRRKISPFSMFDEKEDHAIRTMSNGDLLILTSSYTAHRRNHTMTLYANDWIRCVTDVHTQRFLLCISTTAGNYLSKELYPTWDYVKEIIMWGDNVLAEFGSAKGFKLLKAYEALIVGIIQAQGESLILDNDKFFSNTTYDLISENVHYKDHLVRLRELVLSTESLHWMSQVYGIHRIWGHPLVNAEKGMEKVYTIGQKDIVLSDIMPRRVGNHFKKMFSDSYLKKYGKLPNMKYNGVKKSIQESLENHSRQLFDETQTLDADWEEIEFEETFKIPETFNLSMIVADKSISPTKSELVRNIHTRRSVMNSELRRGVLRWLNDDSIDPREFLRCVNNGNFPDDCKIIALTPKERELNPVPRMFSLMSHLLRVYVVITESMLSEHILPMFSQITMTDSLLELNKKMFSAVKEQAIQTNFAKSKRVSKTFCISLDFEKWNGHMRKQSTKHVFESLGKLFGLPNLYNATYDIFSECYMYLGDGSYTPNIVNNELQIEHPKSFTGHKGGMEGLRQKGWTIFTDTCIDMICKRHDCKYKLMGMGDNQVLIVTFQTNKVDYNGLINNKGIREIKVKLNDLFSNLVEYFGELGLPLKPLETWMSEDLFLYGKYPIYKGVPLAMDLKRLMRIFPLSNEDIMTTENILNTIAGAVQAATQSTSFLGISYIIGLFMMHVTVEDVLNYQPFLGKPLYSSLSTFSYSKRSGLSFRGSNFGFIDSTRETTCINLGNHNISREIVKFMMIHTPRSLGGIVTYHPVMLLMRGFPDPLSMDLSVIRLRFEHSRENVINRLLMRWTCPIYMKNINYSLLIEDILSVNIMKPPTAMASVRQSVASYLKNKGSIRNKEFSNLMNIKNDGAERQLANLLCSGEVLHIRLLHDIYSSTIIGYADSIVSKVTKTATIQRLAVSKSSRDVTSKIIFDEENYFVFFVWRCSVQGETWRTKCPTTHARNIRSDGWLKKLKAVTVAHPISFMSPTQCYSKNTVKCNCNDGYVSVHLSDRASNICVWNKFLGSAPPYFGSLTKEKVTITSDARIYSSEPLVKRPVDLLRVINWFIPKDSNCADIIKYCLKAVTNADPDKYIGVVEGTSGDESHRYKDTSLKHGALMSTNYLYTTHYNISTDNFFRYSRGSENYDLHFQAMLCMIAETMNQRTCIAVNEGSYLNKCYHWKQTCYDCIQKVDDAFYDIPSTLPKMYIPSSPDNKYLYVDQADISYVEKFNPYSAIRHSELNELEYLSMSSYKKYEWLIDMVTDSIASDIIFGGTADHPSNVFMISNAKMYNRVMYLKICPSDLFNTSVNKLILFEQSINECSQYDETIRKIQMEDIIVNSASNNYMGLSLLYTWFDMEKLQFDHKVIIPPSQPPNLSECCYAAKSTVLSFYLNKRNLNVSSRRTNYIVKEMDRNMTTYYMILLNWMMENVTCCACKSKITSMREQSELKNVDYLSCKYGHRPTENKTIFYATKVTMDRLRKDCIKTGNNHVSKGKRTYINFDSEVRDIIPTLSQNAVDLRTMRKRYITYSIPEMNELFGNRRLEMSIRRNLTDMCRIITSPTSASYKWADILLDNNLFTSILRCKGVFLLGDGCGYTSKLIRSFFPHLVVKLSTLIDSENCLPQILSHYKIPGEDESMDSCVHVINNILHPFWNKSWETLGDEFDCVLSDIEINGSDDYHDRITSFNKITMLRKWKIMIIKDYNWNMYEFVSKISTLIKANSKFSLITSPYRQKSYPECWWIVSEINTIENAQVADEIVSYYPEILFQMWDEFCSVMTSTDVPFNWLTSVKFLNEMLCTDVAWAIMESKLRLTFHVRQLGSLLPDFGNFTRLIGKLQSGARPPQVMFTRDSKHLKLYSGEFDKLKDLLFAMGVSMLSDPCKRLRLLNEYPFWYMTWKKGKNLNNWWPSLVRRRKMHMYQGISELVYLIPYLNSYMKKKKLLFKSYGDKIEFNYIWTNGRLNRETLHFPVAKNMVLRI